MICTDLVGQGDLKASDRHLEKRLCMLETFKSSNVVLLMTLYTLKNASGVNCVRMQCGQTQMKSLLPTSDLPRCYCAQESRRKGF